MPRLIGEIAGLGLIGSGSAGFRVRAGCQPERRKLRMRINRENKDSDRPSTLRSGSKSADSALKPCTNRLDVGSMSCSVIVLSKHHLLVTIAV
jgi:hypothetical protein